MCIRDRCKSIGKALMNLKIKKSRIPEESSVIMGEMLRNNKSLIALELEFNKLADKVVEPIIEGLKANKMIAKLNLKYNNIEKSGTIIGAMLKINKTLTKLNLMTNYLDYVSVKDMSEALKVNKTLIDLELSLSLIHICRCRRYAVCRSRWSPYH
eukprot:TRINITY_DN9767_c0_g1_i10.p1 TRINITY_DN9767_c0_g1~~TRINITY_DN9767_c0_g1_i10.p1  ORF type:complete len:155 (-),score=30.93 TRINITY_DN9767_c0_g1_i10:14-478(-)